MKTTKAIFGTITTTSALIVVFAALASETTYAANLLANPDFSAGNTGFSTTYIYDPQGAAPTWGKYTITTSAQPLWFRGVTPLNHDHTTGSGNMMLVDGSGSSNPFWTQTVELAPNTDYMFEGWATSAWEPAPATIQVTINGIVVGTHDLSGQVGLWEQFDFEWNSGSSGFAQIELEDTEFALLGSDFAVDDLSFSPVPEPASLTILGLGVAALLARRHRTF